jgi:phospholipid-binding lipoprotein MlaA
VALDQYAFVRDAYLKRRASLIRDGAPDPNEESYDDFEEESRLEIPQTPVPSVSLEADLLQLEPVASPMTAQQDSNALVAGLPIDLPADLRQSERAKSELGLVN